MELVKVQVPHTTSDPEALALVYDKDRRRLLQQPLDDATKAAMGADLRAFFEAEYQPADDCWKIGKRVDDQNW